MFFTLFHAYKAAEARKSLARVKRSHAQNLMGGSLLGIAVAIDDHALAWRASSTTPLNCVSMISYPNSARYSSETARCWAL
jgi:hypothetical protein